MLLFLLPLLFQLLLLLQLLPPLLLPLPGVWPQLLAYSLYRWENNIRMASVLGFVGAGGLGQMLYVSLSLFQEAQAATVILAMLALVLLVDICSSQLRQRWLKA